MTPTDHAQSARAEFMSRVRTALGRSGSGPSSISSPPQRHDEIVRLAHAGPGLVEMFVAHAASAGTAVHRCTPHTCAATILGILKAAGARRVVAHSSDGQLVALREQVIGSGISIIELGASANPTAAFDADAGITGVAAAVAETGSILVSSGPGRSRAAFIVPPIHVAIVDERQVVPDLLDLWSRFSKPPTAFTLISGPSKTADIEGILVTGVHGPGQLHVVLAGEG